MTLIRTLSIGPGLKRCLGSIAHFAVRKPFSSINCVKSSSLICERKVGNLPKLHGFKYEFKKCTRTFGTSNENKLPFIVEILLQSIEIITAVLLCRDIRFRWKSLPNDKRLIVKDWINKNRKFLLINFSSLILLFYYCYNKCVQETPLTGRRRFIVFNDEQCENKQKNRNELQKYIDRRLPNSNALCKRVQSIVNRLLLANKDIPQIAEKKWSVCVVDAPNVENAFVLPNGEIFVFTGILRSVSNDDQLSIIIAHEMAHAILRHSAEFISYTFILDKVNIFTRCLLVAIAPFDFRFRAVIFFILRVAIFVILRNMIMNIIFYYPRNRMLEMEADEIGLTLTAKACFDVREAVVYWRKMALEANEVEFLSTHLSPESRAANIETLLPKVIEMRNACCCPQLQTPIEE